MRRILELLNLRRRNVESTNNPFWFVAQKSIHGRIILAGIWFNREDAEQFLAERRYRFPKSAHVWCGSADHQSHLAEIYHLSDQAEEPRGGEVRPIYTLMLDADGDPGGVYS